MSWTPWPRAFRHCMREVDGQERRACLADINRPHKIRLRNRSAAPASVAQRLAERRSLSGRRNGVWCVAAGGSPRVERLESCDIPLQRFGAQFTLPRWRRVAPLDTLATFETTSTTVRHAIAVALRSGERRAGVQPRPLPLEERPRRGFLRPSGTKRTHLPMFDRAGTPQQRMER